MTHKVCLYPEDGRFAVKIETSLTEEELAAPLGNCRFFEKAG